MQTNVILHTMLVRVSLGFASGDDLLGYHLSHKWIINKAKLNFNSKYTF